MQPSAGASDNTMITSSLQPRWRGGASDQRYRLAMHGAAEGYECVAWTFSDKDDAHSDEK